jgi:hypothetical protein
MTGCVRSASVPAAPVMLNGGGRDAFLLVRAEGVGFEPTVTLPPQWFSRASVI